jgi:diguanylate cyclase (GGDEF)-like protein/PAS domain S-box-containing protein
MDKNKALQEEVDLKSWMDTPTTGSFQLEKELSKLLLFDFPLFLVATSSDGMILTMNSAMSHALGCTAAETAGVPLSTYLPENDRAALIMMFGRMSMGQQPVKMETGLVGRDGRTFLVQWSGRMIRDSNGTVTANLLAGIDITELRHSNEELKQISGYLENVLDNSPDAIGIVDDKGRLIKWNRRAEELYGYSFDELQGQGALDLFADKEELERILVRLRTEGFVRNLEIGMKRKDGTIIPLEVSLTLLRGKDNKMLGNVCVARDLSDTKRTMNNLGATNRRLQQEIEQRRQTWAALEQSQNLYRTIFENTGTATVIIEEDSTISLANAEFTKLSGCAREEIEGKKSWVEFFKDETLKSMVEFHHLQRVDPNGVPRNFEACFVSSQGQLRHVYVTIAAISDTRKSVASFLDITKRNQMEEELRRSNEELEQRSREISQLNEMLDLLQVCQEIKEIYYVLGRYVRKLFPKDSGKLYLRQDDNAFLEVILEWGEHVTGERVFAVDDCWALRQGKMYIVGDSGGGVACRHVGEFHRGGYLCVPLIADGGIKGLFHLQISPLQTGIPPKIAGRNFDSKQRLAVAVTEHISLALANYYLRETLRMQSVRDPLTGLFNRRFMEESLDRELSQARRTDSSVVIMMLDIDHFKQFNDTHGHEAGDELLKEMGNILLNCGRGEDVACRYGGEEFILIMPGMSIEVARNRAEDIRNQIGAIRITYDSKELDPVTTSIGLSVFSDNGDTAAQILKAADLALYRAKKLGRNCVVVSEK